MIVSSGLIISVLFDDIYTIAIDCLVFSILFYELVAVLSGFVKCVSTCTTVLAGNTVGLA